MTRIHQGLSGIGLSAITLLIGQTVPGERAPLLPALQASELQLACICMPASASPFSASLETSPLGARLALGQKWIARSDAP